MKHISSPTILIRNEIMCKNQKLLNFLNEYANDGLQIKVITNIREIDATTIPNYWFEALTDSDFLNRKK